MFFSLIISKSLSILFKAIVESLQGAVRANFMVGTNAHRQQSGLSAPAQPILNFEF
ncbi:hypothetical protein Prede_1334 [Prevotella dentalis DSM 3688]|uniref:Regulatory protein n=1 Tax=Prevotella dentalis (strain ATCC 49559 / DSM 3688 / JCM 13448 / NCTC 12043 / ES 2772) TaxID=908937 RepID=F9D2Y0_PREDD|nr:hypothetical protein Prede_1334 [Prevotella dentalis DSM 3688]EGQ15447.1 regulatory protein [Prevotella dentalis DSM 3688]